MTFLNEPDISADSLAVHWHVIHEKNKTRVHPSLDAFASVIMHLQHPHHPPMHTCDELNDSDVKYSNFCQGT